MKFNFKIELEKQEITFDVERIYRSRQMERYKVSIVGTKKFIIIQSDRPYIEVKKINKAVEYRLVEGEMKNAHTLQLIFQEIEEAHKNQPPPFQGTLNFDALF